MAPELYDDWATEEGHQLVVLFQEKLISWVFWRWGRPVAFGAKAGSMGEIDLVPRKHGFEKPSTWLVVPHDDGQTAFRAAETTLSRKAKGDLVEVTTTEKDQETLDEAAPLVDACMAMLSEYSEHTAPEIIRRVIHESLCIGVGVKEKSDEADQ